MFMSRIWFIATLCGLLLSGQALATTLTITGNASMQVMPDMATIMFTVSKTAKTASTAKQQADQRVRALQNELGHQSWLHFSSGQLRVMPVYSLDTNKNRQLSGYQARRPVIVKIMNLAKLSDVLGSGLQEADSVTQIRYDSSKRAKLTERVRLAALKNAQLIAHQFAKALNKKVVSVDSIDYNNRMPNQPIQLLREAKFSSNSYQSESLRIDDSVLVHFTLD
ncbi:SIMPL domain-containing protein [Celerinatantimonas diazotrophica]|uniref:Uncharacterized protein YggE n=1 Tax=Celerinatantimonas diazotrophica TaxID=412034 RepID=A0A4R1J9B2_9GAMM|nr:SIMPL domain-containing protein [Celerinatantimonas diazotrophica]TCK46997.1 uncharacterized protein YggE [Celerinatantimonas diazotrophica]CAG9295765.1 hypothetical protein CEDIAZO_00892 [Celerinatantimonas diazotrophica]